jgi:hypothetical protein
MARKCPNCFAVVPATQLLAYSNELACPSCQRPLQISPWSRNISVFAGLIFAAIVWRITSGYYMSRPGALGWALPVFFSYLAYSIVAPLVLILTGDLRLRAEPASPSPEYALSGHSSH